MGNLKITKKIKYEITQEWNEYFKTMSCLKPMWLINILGPLIVGVCLEVKSDSDRYYPRLFLHNLANVREDITFDLSITKSTYIISLKSSAVKMETIIGELLNNSVVPIQGDVSYKDLTNNIKIFCRNTYGSSQLSVLKLLFYLAGWTGSTAFMNDIITFSEEILEQGNVHLSTEKKEIWIKDILNEVRNPIELQDNVSAEKKKWKLEDFPCRKILF